MKTDISTKQIPSVPLLAILWQSHYEKAFPHAETTSLTSKQFGQLKLLQKGLGCITAEVIAWTINNWWTFSLQAMFAAGLPSRPSKPHVGFLLRHYGVAVNLRYEAAKNAKAPKSDAELAFISAVDELIAQQKAEWEESA